MRETTAKKNLKRKTNGCWSKWPFESDVIFCSAGVHCLSRANPIFFKPIQFICCDPQGWGTLWITSYILLLSLLCTYRVKGTHHKLYRIYSQHIYLRLIVASR